MSDGRDIIVCCDGTSNDVSSEPTNVLRLFRSLVEDPAQRCWYDAGVGATSDPTRSTPLVRRLGRLLDMGAGLSLRGNVCRAYRFLAETWRPGDRIWLFGFSRGAYTVRAVAGMIRMLGLTRPEHVHLDWLAWTIYSGEKGANDRFLGGARFGETFSWPADAAADRPAVHFLGVWDTVASYGMVWDLESLPFTSDNQAVAHVRHAVAIDERRALFQPVLFRPGSSTRHTTFKERWFAGTHGDVGGGWPEERAGLAKISLAWMYDEARGLGCRFDVDKCGYFLGRASSYASAPRAYMGGGGTCTSRRPKSTPEPNAPVNDPFAGDWRWHVLEFLPRRSWGGGGMCWHAPHVHARRRIPADAVLHPSVRQKLDGDRSYRPMNLPSSVRFEA